jgi:hypothetical protein
VLYIEKNSIISSAIHNLSTEILNKGIGHLLDMNNQIKALKTESKITEEKNKIG